MEEKELKAGQHLPFIPKIYESGSNYVVMEYFNAPNLKEYLKNEGNVKVTIDLMALKLGIKEKTIRQNVKSLEKKVIFQFTR